MPVTPSPQVLPGDQSRLALAGAPFAVVITSQADGRVIYANAEAERIAGASLQQALGRPAGEFWAAVAERDQLMAQLRQTGRLQGVEVQARRLDGRAFWVQATIMLQPFEGHPAIWASFIDISGLKEDQARLEERRLQLELALDASGQGLWDWDIPSGRVTYDARWAAMLGYRAEELPHLLETWERLVHPEDLPWVQEALQAHVRGEAPAYLTEHRLRHRDGRWIWVRDAGRVVARSADGAPLRAAGTMVDITAGQLAAQALRESEEKHRLLVENSHDIIYTLSPEGVFTYVSPSFRHGLGFDAAEVVGQHFARFTHPDDVSRCAARLAQALSAGEPLADFEHRVLHRDGTWRWYLTNGAALRDPAGGTLGFEGCASCLEERKALEARAARAERASALGTMAAGMAHEINNPLTYALSGVNFAEERLRALPPDLRAAWPRTEEGGLPELEEALAEAGQGARRVRDLVADLRALAAGQQTGEARSDLSGALSRAARVARHAYRAEAGPSFELPPLPSVCGSEAELVQLLTALLINAGQATGGDASKVQVAAERRGGLVLLAVTDAGAGMAPAVLARVFDPFLTTREVGGGRGLGLPVALAIARGLGGGVEVESTVGLGTTVTVTLPVAD